MTESSSPAFVGRVYQNDAETLDQEAFGAIQSQIKEGAKYLMPNLYPAVEPEVDAVLKLIIWNYTVRRSSQTLGQRLLGLSYLGLTPVRSAAYATLTVGVGWLRRRLPNLLPLTPTTPETRQKCESLLDSAEILCRLASLVNLLLFLRSGAFATLSERLLGLRKQRAAPDSASEVNYTYLTREFLWRGFTELLLCVLPLIDFRLVRTSVRSLLPSSTGSKESAAAPSLTLQSRCVWCAEAPVLPQLLQCCHLSCYYCLAAAAGTEQVACAACGVQTPLSQTRPVPVVREA